MELKPAEKNLFTDRQTVAPDECSSHTRRFVFSSNRNPALSETYTDDTFLFMQRKEACVCLHLSKERETSFTTILSNPSIFTLIIKQNTPLPN